MLNPVASGVVTRMVAGFGVAAVAAFGVAGRIEMFAFMIPMTVGMSLLPFMAQNYGAGRMDRVRTAYKGAMTFALGYGLAIAAAFAAAARLLAGFFSKDPAVVDILVRYIRITCFGYGMLEVHRYATFSMTGIHRPLVSAGSQHAAAHRAPHPPFPPRDEGRRPDRHVLGPAGDGPAGGRNRDRRRSPGVRQGRPAWAHRWRTRRGSRFPFTAGKLRGSEVNPSTQSVGSLLSFPVTVQ